MDEIEAKEESRKFSPGSTGQRDISEILIEAIESERPVRVTIGKTIYHISKQDAKECLRKEINGHSHYHLEKYGNILHEPNHD